LQWILRFENGRVAARWSVAIHPWLVSILR
jgi:hypothetical protein